MLTAEGRCLVGLESINKAYDIVHMTFGSYLRQRRELLRQEDRLFSVRQVAQRIGFEPAYLSKTRPGY